MGNDDGQPLPQPYARGTPNRITNPLASEDAVRRQQQQSEQLELLMGQFDLRGRDFKATGLALHADAPDSQRRLAGASRLPSQPD